MAELREKMREIFNKSTQESYVHYGDIGVNEVVVDTETIITGIINLLAYEGYGKMVECPNLRENKYCYKKCPEEFEKQCIYFQPIQKEK